MYKNAFKETVKYYNEIRKLADIGLLHQQKQKFMSLINEKERELTEAQDLQTYNAIQEEITKAKFGITNCDRQIKVANKHRKTFFMEEEREKITDLYNQEITPLIKRYQSLTKDLDKAIATFEATIKETAAEMIEIEDTVRTTTEIRMKLFNAKQLPTRTYNIYADQLTSGSRKNPNTYPAFVLANVSSLKGFTKK